MVSSAEGLYIVTIIGEDTIIDLDSKDNLKTFACFYVYSLSLTVLEILSYLYPLKLHISSMFGQLYTEAVRDRILTESYDRLFG